MMKIRIQVIVSLSFLFAHCVDSIPDKSERKNAIYEKLTPMLLGMYGSGLEEWNTAATKDTFSE